jgi:hypothetical protein
VNDDQATLAAALLAAQKEMPSLQRDSINPHFKNKYVSLDSLMWKILPVLNEQGLVLLQHPTTLEGRPALRTRLLHESGESEEDTMLLVLDKDNPQGQGSAITYARRYAVMAMLGLVADQDDDGAAASKLSKPKPAEALAGFHAHEKIDGLLAQLKAADPSKNWKQVAEKACQRDYGHAMNALTDPEAEDLAGKLQGLLDKQEKAA